MKRGDPHFSGQAIFGGIWPDTGAELWNLVCDIPGHPAGSSVSRETLEAHLAWQFESMRVRLAAYEMHQSGELKFPLPPPGHAELFAKLPDLANHNPTD